VKRRRYRIELIRRRSGVCSWYPVGRGGRRSTRATIACLSRRMGVSEPERLRRAGESGSRYVLSKRRGWAHSKPAPRPLVHLRTLLLPAPRESPGVAPKAGEEVVRVGRVACDPHNRIEWRGGFELLNGPEHDLCADRLG
jgi:hypothetical protein